MDGETRRNKERQIETRETRRNKERDTHTHRW